MNAFHKGKPHMPLPISSSSLFKRAFVSTDDIAAAVAQVKAAGVVESNLKPLVDAFVGATREGRVSATSRKAFEAALFRLVGELPRTPSSLVVRRDEASLTSSIQQAQAVIGKQTTRIAGLEAEVQTLTAELTTKKAEVDDLFTTQTSLEEALSSAKKKQQDNLLLNAFVMILTRGAGAAVANGVATINGVKTVLSINELNAELSAIEKKIAHTSAMKAQLSERLAVVTSTADAQRQSLDGLKLLETSLRAQAAASSSSSSSSSPSSLSERLNGLAVSLEVHQALSNNLGKQIDILETMKAGLATANSELDALIVSLKADNDALRTEIASTERAMTSTLIDLALSMSGAPKQLDLGGLSVSTKTLLLDGIDGVRLQLLAQARGVADNLITNNLIGEPANSAAGRFFLAALNNDRPAALAAADTIVADAAKDALDAAGLSDANGRALIAAIKNDRPSLQAATLDVVLEHIDSYSAPQRFVIEQLMLSNKGTKALPELQLLAVGAALRDNSFSDSVARDLVDVVVRNDTGALASMLGVKVP